MIIKVTQEHIEKGKKNNCWRCPIALAIAEASGGCRIAVLFEHYVIEDEARTARTLPVEAISFIASFDAGLPVAPFEFEIVGLGR